MVNPYRTPGLDPEDESAFGLAHARDVDAAALRRAQRWFSLRPTARRVAYWAGWLMVASLAGAVVAHLAGLL